MKLIVLYLVLLGAIFDKMPTLSASKATQGSPTTFSGVVLATSLAWRMGSVIICPLLYISVLVGLVPIRFPSLLVIVTIVGVVVVLVGILISRPITIVGLASLGFLVIPILLLLS